MSKHRSASFVCNPNRLSDAPPASRAKLNVGFGQTQFFNPWWSSRQTRTQGIFMFRKAIFLAAALSTATTLQAQSSYHWPAPESGEQASQRFYFSSGTPIVLRVTSEINTKDNKAGDRVYLEVAESLTFRGQTIVPAGAPVIAEVSRVQRNGHFGRKGKLEIRLVRMETPFGPVRLAGTEYDEGTSGAVASIATFTLVSPLGFLIKGTSGYIEPGTTFTARLGEKLKFNYQPNTTVTHAPTPEVLPDSISAEPGFSMLD